MSLREAIDKALREFGIEETVNQSYHYWRCTMPDRYEPCDCYDELLGRVTQKLSKWLEEQK